ncbi:MAG: hypothetical protein UZ02_AOB001000848, partial [Nitrosomonas europaea]
MIDLAAFFLPTATTLSSYYKTKARQRKRRKTTY